MNWLVAPSLQLGSSDTLALKLGYSLSKSSLDVFKMCWRTIVIVCKMVNNSYIICLPAHGTSCVPVKPGGDTLFTKYVFAVKHSRLLEIFIMFVLIVQQLAIVVGSDQKIFCPCYVWFLILFSPYMVRQDRDSFVKLYKSTLKCASFRQKGFFLY